MLSMRLQLLAALHAAQYILACKTRLVSRNCTKRVAYEIPAGMRFASIKLFSLDDVITASSALLALQESRASYQLAPDTLVAYAIPSSW